ncbi:Trm112 family protein, partial [Longimicrobium sp.]|uniref:Trm112 family protein n=1 Tax=Longimicrobium sp. TaxID=2029185 RepID=UPI002E33CD43
MHILLTDVLTCPRCGPDFGLILLADRMEERRVAAGHLGCPNCRAHYPVRDRVVDLRIDGSADSADSADPTDSAVSADFAESTESAGARSGDEIAVRMAALMGLAGASGTVLVAGPGAGHAAAVAALVPELEVIALSEGAHPPVVVGAGERVSPVRASGAGLPFRGGLRAAALTGGADDARLREGLRVLAPGARLVVDPAPA